MTEPTGQTSAAPEPATAGPATPFHDLDAYAALPRLAGLALSPDGTRLVTAVSTLNPERNAYRTALWEVDPAGARPARRLTRSAKGEGQAAYLPDGSLLFVSARPDPEAKEDDETPALWQLPAAGGEARVLARRPGGIDGVRVARDSGLVVVGSDTFPSAVTAEDDEKIRKQRKDGTVDAILHERDPIRYWDHDLGPDEPRLLCGTVPDPAPPGAGVEGGRIELRDLTPAPGRSLVNAGWDVTPDGATVITSIKVTERGGEREALIAIDVATGGQRPLLDDPDREFASPVVDPTGQRAAVTVWRRSSPTAPPDVDLGLLDLGTGALRIVAEGWDRWPGTPAWTPDGAALIVAADEHGRCPLFRIDLAATDSGADRVTRNGDVCNKIGTYLKALAAADNGVPFHVCLPSPTIDWRMADGLREIPIEQRAARELTHVAGRASDGALVEVRISPAATPARNDAFDVTPARLVTGLVTERGVCAASRAGLEALFPDQRGTQSA